MINITVAITWVHVEPPNLAGYIDWLTANIGPPVHVEDGDGDGDGCYRLTFEEENIIDLIEPFTQRTYGVRFLNDEDAVAFKLRFEL